MFRAVPLSISTMHGPLNFKIRQCQIGKGKYQYGNTKEKPHITNAAMWHNKMWTEKQLTPNCTAIKTNGKKTHSAKITKYGHLNVKPNYRVIRNDCWGFNNLSYTIHLR